MQQADVPEIIICDDHPIVGEALRMQLHAELGASVHLTHCFRHTAMLAATLHRLDLLILDINLPGEDAAANVATARSQWPGTAIVLFSGTDDPAQLRFAASCGAHAFLSKSLPPGLVLAALRGVLNGERQLVPDALPPQPAPMQPHIRLTERQMAVLRCLAEGRTNKDIARTLSVSPATIKVHLAQIFGLLGVANRTEAVITALKLGLLP